MKNVSFLPVVLLLAGCASSVSDEERKMTAEKLLAHSKEIHQRVLTIDTHDDIPFNFATEEVDPGVRGKRQVDIPKMIEGQLDVGFFIVYVGQTERTPENYAKAKARAMTKFNAIHRMTEKMYPDKIELAYTTGDVDRISDCGKLVACIGIENGYAIGQDLSLLKKYYDLGARYITLAHAGHNDIADSATPRLELGDEETEHHGISDFGEKVIAEMNRLGIMVDVSHISKQAMLQASRLSRVPVIASHSSTRALCDHPRNMDDEQLLALQKNGGVIQIVAVEPFLKKTSAEKEREIEKLRDEMEIGGRGGDLGSLSKAKKEIWHSRRAELDKKWPHPGVIDLCEHIDHAVRLIGIDHVGISSDFDGGGGIDGWRDASETFNVTLELVRRGYCEEEIMKLWGGNLLRVWRKTESFARGFQSQKLGTRN